MKILIVGGAGDMGSWFVDFFEEREWEVAINDPEAKNSVSLEKVGEFDVVLISVPIESTTSTIEHIGPKVEGLLMDITSVKEEPVKAMKKYTSEDTEILGTHPMFGPSVREIRGQTVILVEERIDKLGKKIKNEFREAGADLKSMDAKKHDKVMSVVQGLTHFSYISVGKALEKLNFDISESREFMSPVYEIMLDFVGRILDQNPDLYASIQRQHSSEIRNALIESSQELKKQVEENKEKFIDTMRDSAIHYGDTKGAHARSDKLIEASVAEREELHKSIGQKKALRHIRSGTVHIGKIENIDGKKVIMKEGGKKVEIKIDNIELLNEKEKKRWERENLQNRYRDISVILNDEIDKKVLKNIIINCCEEIIETKIIDTYKGSPIPDGNISYTIRIKTLEKNIDNANKKVRKILEGIGGEIR